MANKIPLAFADVELQLSSAISIGDTSFTLSSATDDDGVALPAGKYCFTVDNGTSAKEYLIGQLNGTTVTTVVSVSRQGAETSGAARAHRVGAPAILTDFATIQRVAAILTGTSTLDGASPISYDTEPTLSDNKQLATVAYVLSVVNGGTVNFDSQVISPATGGENIVLENLIYFKTSDQEWYLCDADTAATVDGTQLALAKGTGSDGVAITGGVHISGVYTTSGLTAGSIYYASNTAGAIGTSAGTTSVMVGIALSTTKLLFTPRMTHMPTGGEKAALAGGGNFGTPSTSNKFVTEDFLGSTSTSEKVTFNASGTWTKDAGLVRVLVQAWGGGGGGAATTGSSNEAGGGGGGGFSEKWFEASELASTETVTIGAGGAAVSNADGNTGNNTTFGSLLTAYGGGAGGTDSTGGGGGGGGGPFGIGGSSTNATAGVAGSPGTPVAGTGGDGSTGSAGGNALYGGGGGGAASGAAGAGGSTYYGGGGGGGASGVGVGAGSTSVRGGAGGAANNSASGDATSGSQPAGGGGAKWSNAGTGNSGAGGNGRIVVYEFYT